MEEKSEKKKPMRSHQGWGRALKMFVRAKLLTLPGDNFMDMYFPRKWAKKFGE